jgi:hypothetical protein
LLVLLLLVVKMMRRKGRGGEICGRLEDTYEKNKKMGEEGVRTWMGTRRK